ncbi:sugar phosphate isomerase/epimerase family protein [Catenuloplanes atrovinosus]|uniref:Sugar phosphate isomerase/epimerase n=1 Tax=Catenuloplanes atrovinosus TaxID=137266 RepID=A0AAE3YPA8_9ACTN|nr:sugar phosphate isomerase/epimerase [Catenuloplanes atrovinosus]MDR7275391.1 sugar phosphate isomerase/epimerase [Catenuloplanes atrovinosus]
MSSVLAVQLYTVRDRLAEDRPGTLRALADAGYGAVEPFQAHRDPHALRADLDAAGLSVCSAHTDVLGDDADAALAAAPVLGTDTLIQAYLPPDRFTDADAVADTARRLNAAAVRAGDLGLRVGYHNHHWEVGTLISGRTALEVLADRLAPEVLLEVDLYWAATGGADVPALLGRLGDRVRYLHVKDGPATVEGPMTAVGEGVVPIAASLAAAPGAQRIVELDRCAGDVLDALVASAAALR